MNFGRISVAAALLCLSLVTHVPGQQGGRASTTAHLQQGEKDVSVTITEPGSYTLAQLYKAADIVALVKVIAADDESYLRPVYKSKVIAGFRGVREGQTLYFGPFTHNKLGAEYFVFLKSEKQPLAPNNGSAAGFGTVPYAVDFDDGFTAMESSYQCAFPGKKIEDQCDDGVRVCTDFIKLPKATKVSEDEEPGTSGCRWARKRDFLSILSGY